MPVYMYSYCNYIQTGSSRNPHFKSCAHACACFSSVVRTHCGLPALIRPTGRGYDPPKIVALKNS